MVDRVVHYATLSLTNLEDLNDRHTGTRTMHIGKTEYKSIDILSRLLISRMFLMTFLIYRFENTRGPYIDRESYLYRYLTGGIYKHLS